MRLSTQASGLVAALLSAALACDSCFGPTSRVEHVRSVKRMQPGAQNATYGPTRPLEWGQLNVLHTTDTHGWLEGHLKEQNYGADFGDFVTFATHLQHKAGNMGVDLLLIDTGDLHDGTGLSDATTPDGETSNKIFENLDYDLLTIGNHELYLSSVAYQVFDEFSKYWGDKYLTSNVQVLNPATEQWEYVGQKYKYFTTKKGIRIMAFGILFDFTGNTNVSKVIHAADLVQESWFVDTINTTEPVDLFLLIGHNIARPTTDGSTFGQIQSAIRALHPNTPIQIFGGHSHIRDFAVIDESSTALESGRYCETVGWFSMSGFNSTNSGYNGIKNAHGVPNPTRKAVEGSSSPWVYSRRYLDWNRYTFEYHAIGKQDASAFDYHSGERVTDEISTARTAQRLGTLYGCVPDFYCATCVSFLSETSIFTVLTAALTEIVVNPARNTTARMIFANTGSVRFDMYKGSFTYDDNFIVSPFTDVFLYVPDVPYSLAKDMLASLNAGGASKKRADQAGALPNDLLFGRDACVDPQLGLVARDQIEEGHGIARRQTTETAGYTTTDDFGTDGDDTAHSSIPYYSIPNYFAANGTFPETGEPDVVDLIFVDYIESYVLGILGSNYTADMVTPYISENFTTQDYLLPYVEANWQAGLPDCPI